MGLLKTLFSFAMWIVAIALTVGAVLKLFFVDVIVLGHDAMAPTITVGEQVFLWRGAKPELADIAVCANPARPAELVVGRVLGTPGQSVKTEPRRGLVINRDRVETDIEEETRYSVTTNGRVATVHRVVETFAGRDYTTFYPASLALEFRPVEVEPGRLFLLGDNRAFFGHDSRSFGTVDAATCRGTVFMRFRPTDASAATFAHGYFDLLL